MSICQCTVPPPMSGQRGPSKTGMPAVKGVIHMTVILRFVVVFVAVAISVPSIVQAQSFSAGPPLVVVDSNGAEVGHLLEGWNAVVIANDLAVSIQVQRERLTSSNAYELFFTQPDCTGDVYLWARDFANTPLAPGAMGPTGMLFVAEYGSASPITALSKYNYGHQACYNQTSDLGNALAAVPSVNLETMFVPPFTVRPASSAVMAGVPVPQLTPWSTALLIIFLGCFAFFRLRSTN